ncbi:hypothetical protein ACTFIR_002889 [Dictyostelium discoideum]
MKVIYIYIYILLLVCKFLFVKSSCSLIEGKFECENEFETFELYNGTVAKVKMDTVEGKYYFNSAKFPFKNLLCDINAFNKFTPELPSFPNLSTTGGELWFTFNFPCLFSRKIKQLSTEGNFLNVSFDLGRNQFFAIFPPGCSALNLISQGVSILNTTYETGAIPNVPILDDDKGILTIQGSNLLKTSIKFIQITL